MRMRMRTWCGQTRWAGLLSVGVAALLLGGGAAAASGPGWADSRPAVDGWDGWGPPSSNRAPRASRASRATSPDIAVTGHGWGKAIRVGGENLESVNATAFGPGGELYLVGKSDSRWSVDKRTCRYADRRECGMAFVTRVSAAGEVAWTRSFGGGEDAPGENTPEAWAVMQNVVYQPATSLVVVQGVWAQPLGPGFQRTLFVAALRPEDGAHVWMREFDERDSRSDSVGGEHLFAMPDGSLVLGGETRSDFGGKRHIGGHVNGAMNGFDVWVCKLDPRGQLLWTKMLGVPDPGPYDAHNDYLQAMAIDPKGVIHIYGGTHGDIVRHRKKWRWKQFHVKLSQKGRVLDADYFHKSPGIGAAVFAADGSEYRLVHLYDEMKDKSKWRSLDANLAKTDLALEKRSPRGRLEWAVRFGTDKREYGTHLAMMPNGDVMVGGVADLHGAEDGLAMAFSPDGERRWAWRIASERPADERFYGKQHDHVLGLAVDGRTGDVAIVGSTSGDLLGNRNVTQPSGIVPDDGFALVVGAP